MSLAWRWRAVPLEMLSIIVLSSHIKMHLQKSTNDHHRLTILLRKAMFYAGECNAHNNYWYTWKYATGYSKLTSTTCTSLVDFNVNLFKQDYNWKSYVDLIYCRYQYERDFFTWWQRSADGNKIVCQHSCTQLAVYSNNNLFINFDFFFNVFPCINVLIYTFIKFQRCIWGF